VAGMKILVVDDHPLFRKGVAMLVDTFSITEKVFEASNGQEAIDLLRQQAVDIVLLDLDMPVMTGKEAAKVIVNDFPEVSIIMVSMNDSLEIISEMIEIGVHSYLVKGSSPEELEKAINYVVNNDFYYNQLVSKALHKRIKDRPTVTPSGRSIKLTPREIEILGLICEELTMKEIGEQLFLSEQTIHTHRKNLMKKAKVSNAVGLVKYAIREHVVYL
jgi:two-component system response regulator DegU